MADYYPLIAKAVSGLDKNTGEIRRVLYDRARTALVGQLRGVDPPLNESDITRERLALEEAIRKVETEASMRRSEADEGEIRPSLSDEGLRGFRAVVAEAEGLGDAATQANRAAHDVLDAVPGDRPPGEPPFKRTEFAPEQPPVVTPSDTETSEASPEPTPERPQLERGWEPPPPPRFDEPHPVDEQVAYSPPVQSHRELIKIVAVMLIVAAAVGAAYWQRHAISSLVAGLRSPPAATTTTAQPQPPMQPAGRPKISDRVGGDNAPNAANAPAASVAQKVVLYDEDPNDPNGKRYVGSAIWRTETVSPGPGLAPEIAVRADVEIPERHLRMTWSLRRNTDKALPASHTIEIVFTLPADFSEGGVNSIPGVLMKADEQARGVPLAGLAVKVTDGYFLLGLSAVDADVQRNIELLKTRDWMDIPVVYVSGKRAILAMEKGIAGSRVFEEAFRAWGQ
jgi:hypothetical protein